MDQMEVLWLRDALEGREVWKSGRSLSRMGIGAGMLRALEYSGMAERWVRDARGKPFISIYWTLTPWGASALGLDVDEDEHGVPRWVAGEAAGPIRIRQQFAPLRYPNLIPDPRSSLPYLLDESGALLEIMGRPVKVDPRLGKKPAPRRGAKGRRAG